MEKKTHVLEKNGILIKRQFKGGAERKDDFSVAEIDSIINYVNKNGKCSLANNVQTLRKGTEKEGLGKFVYENSNKDTTRAQAVSQLVAIFVWSGIFGYNGVKRGMEFWVLDYKWKDKIKNFI